MRKIIFFIILILSIKNIYVYGQNCDCSDILKYGVYNHFSNTDKVDNYSKLQTSITNSYKQSKSGTGGGGIGFKGLTGNYSESEAKAIEKITSGSKLDENDLRILQESGSKFISHEMMDAYKSCLNLCSNNGFEVKIDLPSDGRFSEITVTLKYKRPDFQPKTPIINSISVDSTCYTCFGNLYDLSLRQDTMQSSILYKMICKRKIKNDFFKLPGTDNTLIYAKDALISIHTDLGAYNIRIPPLYAKNPERLRGIGEVLASTLTKEKFLEAYGEKSWMLADGSEVPIGSEYRTYIDNYLPYMKGKAPDLRGRFLRGFNNDLIINPDNTQIGQPQEDAFQGHYHNMGGKVVVLPNPDHRYEGDYLVASAKGSYKESNLSSNLKKQENIQSPSNDGINGNPKISSETRPKSITVNYFIKIN